MAKVDTVDNNGSIFGAFGSLFGGKKPEANGEGKVVYTHVLQQMRAEFPQDVRVFVEKYPAPVAIYLFAAIFFAFNVISINPFSILNGLFHIGVGGSLAKNVWDTGMMTFAHRAFAQFKECYSQVQKEGKEDKPENQKIQKGEAGS